MSKLMATYRATRTEPWPGLPDTVEIKVHWFDAGEDFRAESHDLGMGHPFDVPDNAAADLARRHGYEKPTLTWWSDEFPK